MKLWWKRIHNWFGLSSAIFLVVLLVTGILLNHPDVMKDDSLEAVAVDPNQKDRMLVGKKDGLYVSEDSGKTWQEVPMLFPPQEVVDVQFSPIHAQQVYVLERWGRIYASLDGGKVWKNIRIPLDPQVEGIELKKISIGAQNQMVLLTSHGYLTSADGGETWDESFLDKKQQPVRRLIKTLHNGYFFGPRFVWLYDFSAIALLILIITGIYLWYIGRKAS